MNDDEQRREYSRAKELRGGVGKGRAEGVWGARVRLRGGKGEGGQQQLGERMRKEKRERIEM